MTAAYVHGYTEREGKRLCDQARTLEELLHDTVRFPDGATVLEAGCGVGAQTVALARNNPRARITAVDINEASVAAARQACGTAGLSNITFRAANLLEEPFPDATFDHVFVCFVLEHLPDPVAVLKSLWRVLKPGGTITVIEGDHGSTFFHPHGEMAMRAIQCQVELQARAGGDACIGRRLYPLLEKAGFARVTVEPRPVYADAERPEWVEGFTKNTFTAMIEGVREEAVRAGLITGAEFDAGLAELRRAAEADGTFFYTFFRAMAVRT